MRRSYYIIVNPVARKGKAKTKQPVIEKFFASAAAQGEVERYILVQTEYPGHAIELARQAAISSWDVVVAAGGDGTGNEVINGLMLAKTSNTLLKTYLGLLPIGRGNDFSFGAGVSTDLAESLEQLTSGTAHPLDVGKITGGLFPEGRFFGNGIGVGFDTIVGLEAAKMKCFGGVTGYLLAAIKTLIIYPKPPQVTLTVTDGDHQNQEYTLEPAIVSVMNGKRMGGSFYMAPEGEVSDGLFNLCTTEHGSRLYLLKAMLMYAKGTQDGHHGTFMLTGTRFILSSSEGRLACHADGETICTDGTHLEVEIQPGALDLLK
ncbi:MAG: diacylglycerol/lipid kinase family protein [Spirochaetota bacterium]